MSVSYGSFDVCRASVIGQHGHIKSSSAKVNDDQVFIFDILSADTEAQGSSCWLVDDLENIEASEDASITSGIPLCVVEVSRTSDNAFSNLKSELFRRVCLHILQDYGRNLLR